MFNHRGTVVIKSSNLTLRRFTIEDAPIMFKNWASDHIVNMYLKWETHKNIEETETVINEFIERYSSNTYYNWVIELNATHDLVGSIGAKFYNDVSLPNIIFCIGKNYWGKGIAAEALNLVTEFLFTQVGVHSVGSKIKQEDYYRATTLQNSGMFIVDKSQEGSDKSNILHLKNHLASDDFSENKIPIFFKPIFEERIWGGTALRDKFGFKIPSEQTAEYWGVSAVPDRSSEIRNGKYKGLTLETLYKEHRELFGNIKDEQFPLLVKLIDASKDLSVQVHPNDEYAKTHGGTQGKTECWYILDCKEDGSIIYGHTAQTKEEMQQMIQDEKWSTLFNTLPVKPEDFVMVESGKIHAIKANTMLLEIQQTCDITYRIYDYDRLDNGVKRPLHIQNVLEVTPFPDSNVSFKQSCETDGNAKITCLISSDKFTVHKYEINNKYEFNNNAPFQIVCVTKGEGKCGPIYIKEGSIFLIPSTLNKLIFEGNLEFITATV